jgi:2-succinyl-6-hydroxy-2,4-cyclohexadiene-1-carboxylate synthase
MGKARLMSCISRFGEPSLPHLVLLHGFLGSKQDWLKLMPLLSQHFHCICIDLPGHGQHALPKSALGMNDLAINHLANSMLEKLSALSLTDCHLLGYSLGGRLALHMAARLKDDNRFKRINLLSLTLVSAHPGLEDISARNDRKAHDNQWLNKFNTLPYEDFLKLWYQQTVFANMSLDAKTEMIAWRQAHFNAEMGLGLSLMSLGNQEDCRSIPSKLSCPCHVFVGALDEKFVALSKAWQALAPIKLRVFENAGHTLHSSQPKMFADTLIHLLGSPANPSE